MLDNRIAFTGTALTSQENHSLSVAHLIRCSSTKSSSSDPTNPFVVIFTNGSASAFQTTISSPILGVYFPSPVFVSTTENTYTPNTGSSRDCIIFQLRPTFQLLECSSEKQAKLVEMFQGTNESPITESSLAGTFLGSETTKDIVSDAAYWIRYPRSETEAEGTRRTGLHVDPVKGTVSLVLEKSTEDDSKCGIETPDEEISEFTVSNAVMHIFAVSGGEIRSEKRKEPLVYDHSKYTRDPYAPRVDGEELKARIEGFGSN